MAELDLADLKVRDIEFESSGYQQSLEYIEGYLKRSRSLKGRIRKVLLCVLDSVDAFLRSLRKKLFNTSARAEKNVLAKYDEISGSYIRSFEGEGTPVFVKNRSQRGVVNSKNLHEYKSAHISGVINHYGDCASILEVGAGEFTSLYSVVTTLNQRPKFVAGLDLSWSRVQQGVSYCESRSFHVDRYICGNAASLPFPDKSIDYLYTVHCLEQMPSVLEQALKEFNRVARRKIILLEPSHEHGEKLQREWIDMKGYVKGIRQLAESLGMSTVLDCALPVREFHINSGLMVLTPTAGTVVNQPDLVCPVGKTALREIGGVLHSEETGLSYPVIGKIPCLDEKHGVLTGKLSQASELDSKLIHIDFKSLR